MLSEAVRQAARDLWTELRIARRAVGASRRFRGLRGRDDLRLNLGCGADLKPGWVNIDLDLHGKVPPIAMDAPAGTLFINFDLRSGLLPLDDGSCALIYSSHLLEHLEYEQGLRLMRDCYRVLRRGGVFRTALPTFKELFRAYLDGDQGYFDAVDIHAVRPEVEAGTETLVDQVNYGVYQHGEHKSIYDEEKLCLLLRRIGFSAAPAPFDPDVDPANDLRRRYSFYVEAVK